MKKTISIFCLMMVVVFTNFGCKSSGNEIARKRDELDKKEPWRYEIPLMSEEPVAPTFPKIQKSKLSNGLEIFVVEDHRLPIVNIELVLKGGSSRDPHNFAGLNYLTAQMLKEGAGKFSSLQLAERFANLGTEVSVGVNKDMVALSAEVLSHQVDEITDLLALMVTKPRFLSEDFDRVKLQHQSVIASQQANPSYVAQTSFLLAAYGDKHPYSYPSAGTLKTISGVKLNNIKNTFKKSFGPNVAALIVVGDVSLAQIEKVASKHLASWNNKVSSSVSIQDPEALKQMQTRLLSRNDAPQTYILVGMLAANRKDKNIAALEVFKNIIAGLPTSRLGENLREQKGWTYGVAGQINPLLGKGPLLITSSIQAPFGADALKEILAEFENMKAKPVSEEELKIAKNGLLRSFASRYSTIGQIGDILAEQFVYSLPLNSEEALYKDIKAVSAQDVLGVAKQMLKKDQTVFVAVGDLETLKTPLATMDVGKVQIEKESSN